MIKKQLRWLAIKTFRIDIGMFKYPLTYRQDYLLSKLFQLMEKEKQDNDDNKDSGSGLDDVRYDRREEFFNRLTD